MMTSVLIESENPPPPSTLALPGQVASRPGVWALAGVVVNVPSCTLYALGCLAQTPYTMNVVAEAEALLMSPAHPFPDGYELLMFTDTEAVETKSPPPQGTVP